MRFLLLFCCCCCCRCLFCFFFLSSNQKAVRYQCYLTILWIGSNKQDVKLVTLVFPVYKTVAKFTSLPTAFGCLLNDYSPSYFTELSFQYRQLYTFSPTIIPTNHSYYLYNSSQLATQLVYCWVNIVFSIMHRCVSSSNLFLAFPNIKLY